jgi:formylglycine-generating enzyme required for sulfatase activity
MNLPDGLDSFLAALRFEGVPVGPGELIRLQHAFSLEPVLDRQELQALLACTLIKDPAQRTIFASLFEDWCPEETPALEQDQASQESHENFSLEENQTAWHQEIQRKTLEQQPQPDKPLLVDLTQPAGLLKSLPQQEEERRHPSFFLSWRIVQVTVTLLVLGLLGIATGNTLSAIWTWFSRLAYGGSSLASNRGLLAGLGFGAWLVSLSLWLYYRRRARLPPSADPLQAGPAWLPLLALESRGPELLDADAVRTLIWGVGRFVSEEFTCQLNLRRTVTATARAGGIATIHYQRAVYPREVWLWQDASTQDPTLERLTEELVSSLNRAGLPVRRGVFAEVPERVRWREGQVFSPLVLEGHRQSALVAVLTDGGGMAIASQSELDRRPLIRLLQSFTEWPQLAFVDFGRGRYGLATLLQTYGLRCIAPEGLPAFLGAGEAKPVSSRGADTRLLGDLRAWAAALALAPDPMDERSAYELLHKLQLALSPWCFQELVRCAEDLGGRIAWSPPRRIELLNWLAQAESLQDDKVTDDSLLGKALQFWIHRYQEERQCRQHQEQHSALLPWKNTLAAQRLDLEIGLLELWRNPQKATDMLYPLFRGELKEEVQTRLADYAPRDYQQQAADRQTVICLPWVWRDQLGKVRRLLWEMGLRGDSPGPLRVPGTVSLAVGLGLGTAIAAAVGAGGVAGVALGLTVAGTAVPVVRYIREQREKREIPELLAMIELPGGTFLMGSPESDDQAYSDEKPQHEVTVSSFAMSRFLVTRKLYREILGRGPSEWEGDQEDDLLPANYVSWFDAVEFCNALSKQVGLRPCYRRLWLGKKWVRWDRNAEGYRLPTEAEWEYAVRAGTTTRWFCGDEPTELERYAWFDKNSENRVHPVGEKEPNSWGFYDLAGNVWEWCWDWYDDYSSDSATDPAGPLTGAGRRVLRGGAFCYLAWLLRSAVRDWNVPEVRSVVIGFRCVRAARRQHLTH